MPKNYTPEDSHLPDQTKFFSQDKLRRSARAGTQLPDPKREPYGYDAKSRFDHIFPRITLPPLHPPYSHHRDDTLGFGAPDLPPHELYLGDNLSVLRNIPSESIDLIYIDPPFFSNRTYTQIWGDENEVRSFGDIFEDGMPSYLAWLNARLWEMKRVLKNTGSIYIHCDWHASHYIKCEMDKIFGYDNFLNEIVWNYDGTGKPSKIKFGNKHDLIFRYAKDKTLVIANKITFRQQIDKSYSTLKQDTDGRYFRIQGTGDYTEDSIERLRKEGRIYVSATGKRYVKYWIDVNEDGGLEKEKTLGDTWNDIDPIDYDEFLFDEVWTDVTQLGTAEQKEKIGYPTQKPEKLLERIIEASARKGDVVADFFMGGGTTGAVAMKLGRRFIGSDISRVAVSVTAGRLAKIGEEISGVSIEDGWQGRIGEDRVADIHISYVGSYPVDKFKGMGHDEFVRFILGLYSGMPYSGTEHEYIHGTANSKLVLSIGDADPESIISADYVKRALEATIRAYQRQLTEGQEKILQVIGWKFAPEIDAWRRQTTDYLNKKGLKIQIQIIALGSETFRERVFSVIGESNIDLKFNRLNAMLSFAGTPYAGVISLTPGTTPKRVKDGIAVSLSLIGARPVGQARLINAQWDMDMRDGRFADREHALNREGKNGDFTAILTLEHTFPEVGEYLIGGRVQDSMDGEGTTTARIRLTEKMDGSGTIECEIERLS